MVIIDPGRIEQRFVECASDMFQEVIPRSNLRPLAAKEREQVMDQCLQDILQTQRSIPLQKGMACSAECCTCERAIVCVVM